MRATADLYNSSIIFAECEAGIIGSLNRRGVKS